MRAHLYFIGLTLALTTGLFGADNFLTPQEKAAGWVLLFDGKTLNGWEPSLPAGIPRGRCSEKEEGVRTAGRCAGARLQSTVVYRFPGASLHRARRFTLGGG